MDTLAGTAPLREYADGKMLAAKDGGIGFITFNQPEKRNAMSVEMWQGLAEILDDFRDDPAVRVAFEEMLNEVFGAPGGGPATRR